MESKTGARNWYVAYTLPNAEKSVYRSLTRMQITSFLPLQRITRKWGDRKVKIFTPLFPSYLFIYSSHTERYEALDVKGLIKYVSFNGKPAIVKDEQIEAIKIMLNRDMEVHAGAAIRPGKRVRITDGPFCGVEGVVERLNGRSRFIVRIECLNRAVSVDVSEEIVTSYVGL